MDYYKDITIEEIKQLIKNLKYIHEKNYKYRDDNNDGESVFLSNMYSERNSFGSTDYKDHRNDSFKDLKEYAKECLLKNLMQRGNYYDDKNNIVDTIIMNPYYGGRTNYFIYKSGKNAFGR